MPEPLTTQQGDVSESRIDLSLGHPSPSLLPLEILREAAAHRLGQADPSILQYGYEQGDGRFRRALAGFLGRQYGTPVDPDHLFVTNGVSQALDLLCTLYARPGDLVWCEEPSYFLALRIFADHHLRVASLPTDEDGLVVEAVEERLAAGERPVFLYTVPTHQNPSGATLPLARRRRLAELGGKHGFRILADEVYHLLSYGRQPPPSFGTLAAGGAVLSLGSFSKILAPGLRLGWIQAAPERLQPLARCGQLDSGGGLNPFTSALVRSAIELGRQEEHLERLKTVYRKRIQALGDALRRELAGLARFREPDGGFFFWVGLPERLDAERLLPAARERGVSFNPGARFSSRGGLRNFLRLSFARYEESELAEGVRRLAGALGDRT